MDPDDELSPYGIEKSHPRASPGKIQTFSIMMNSEIQNLKLAVCHRNIK